MFDIGKLAKGQFTYYLQGIADDQVDYYLGRGEADGYWFGGGAAALNLTGAILREQRGCLLRGDGRLPPGYLDGAVDGRESGTTLPPSALRIGARSSGRPGRVRPAWERVAPRFTATTSLCGRPRVSVCCITFGSRRCEKPSPRHRASVAAVMQYLERHCAVARRGAGGRRRLPRTD